MRKINLGLEDVKLKIQALKGEEVAMNINRGRKKIDTINCVIKDVYCNLSVFVSTTSHVGVSCHFEMLRA